MSGDAQPRKRKDKKKKKGDPVALRTDQFLKEKSGFRKLEDSVEDDFFVPLKHSTDEVIHLQKDITCGGNVVTKLIFFGLLATIGVMVGFILLEYRGSTDEETSSAVDSPWSVTFHDWVDVADTGHDHEEAHLIEEHDHGDHEEHDHEEQELDIHEEDEHDDHEEELHHYEEELHHYEEDEIEKKESWLFSWISLGSVSDEGLESKVTEEDDAVSSSSIFSWFQSNEKEQDDEREESNGGGWFGFGIGQQDAEEENPEVDFTSSEAVDKDEDHGEGSDEMSDDYEKQEEEENDEEETDEEEEEEIVNEEEEDKDEENESEEIDNAIDDAEEEDDKSEEISHEIEEEEEEEEDENDLKDEDNESRENNSENEDEDDKFKELNEEEEDNDSKELINDEEDESGEKSEEVNEKPEEEEGEEESENISFDRGEDNKNEDNSDDDDSSLFANDEKYEESDHLGEELDEQDLELDPKRGDSKKISIESKKESEPSGDEELFPEAREALRREAEEMKSKVEELNEKEFIETVEEDIDSGKELSSDDNDEETEGTGGDDEVGPSIESIGVPSEQYQPITETPVVVSAPVKTESVPPVKPPPQPEPEPPKFADEATIEEVSADEESPVEEGSPVEEEEEEEEEEEQEDEDLEIDQQKFRDLLAKYGQETPESTDEERVDYSEGDESPADDERVEHEVVSEDEAGSEDDLKEWTGIKKSDIQVETDSEDEEVEEESDDEPPPPPPQPSRKKGGQRDIDEDYANSLITNDEDWAIREELDRADEEFNYEKARTLYRALLFKHPDSPRARYGLAQTLDRQAEHERSNVLLDLAITGYKDALEAPNITDILFIQIATRLIDRLRFRGHHMKAVPIHNSLIQKFNTTPEYRTDLAITYLMIGGCSIDIERIAAILESRSVCPRTLWPDTKITR